MWAEPRVTFVYDEFMEYAIAKELIIKTMMNVNHKTLEVKLKRVLNSAASFSSVYGVVAYLLPMMEEKFGFDGWIIVYQRGSKWKQALSKALYRASPNSLSESAVFIADRLARKGRGVILLEMLKLAEGLLHTQPNNSIRLFRRLLHARSPQIWKPALSGLMKQSIEGNILATKALVSSLRYTDRRVRCRAVYSLADLGKLPEHMIAGLAKDRCEYVREAAIYSVKTVFSNENADILTNVLIRAQQDSITFVREAAFQELYKIRSLG